MNTLILVGGLVIVGMFALNRAIPDVGEALKKTTGNLEYEKTKDLGIANVGEVVTKEVKYKDPNTGQIKSETRETTKGPYGQCTTDSTCQSDALFGAKYRCIGGTCTPLVGMRNVVGGTSLYNPVELGVHKVCNKYYLGGNGSPCTKNTQCSTSGLTCDPNDSSCVAAIWDGSDPVYCGDNNTCKFKTNPDWLGVRWRQEDLTYKRVYELGFPDKVNQNIAKITELSQINNCPEIRNELTPLP